MGLIKLYRKKVLTDYQPSPIMIPMPRGNQYAKVRLDYLNTILRPNATVVVSRKFADILEFEAEEVHFKQGRDGEEANNLICKRAKLPDMEVKTSVEIEE